MVFGAASNLTGECPPDTCARGRPQLIDYCDNAASNFRFVRLCGFSLSTGSLVSSEGALKRFKFAAPERRMRVCPWVDPQPRDFPVSLLECGAAAPPRSVGLCGVVSAVAPCPQLSKLVTGTETNKRDVIDHGNRKDLHHFHDFFHNLGTAEAARGVTT